MHLVVHFACSHPLEGNGISNALDFGLLLERQQLELPTKLPDSLQSPCVLKNSRTLSKLSLWFFKLVITLMIDSVNRIHNYNRHIIHFCVVVSMAMLSVKKGNLMKLQFATITYCFLSTTLIMTSFAVSLF